MQQKVFAQNRSYCLTRKQLLHKNLIPQFGVLFLLLSEHRVQYKGYSDKWTKRAISLQVQREYSAELSLRNKNTTQRYTYILNKDILFFNNKAKMMLT